MSTIKLNEIQIYFDTTLYEMSNFFPNDTGLAPGTKLWVRTEPEELPHTKYRIKLVHPQHGAAVFALWGDEPKQVEGDWIVSGKDLKQLTTLLAQTHNEIRAHTDGEISSAELGDAFRRAK